MPPPALLTGTDLIVLPYPFAVKMIQQLHTSHLVLHGYGMFTPQSACQDKDCQEFQAWKEASRPE